MIDLRSDTVTKPTKEMIKAMAEAELGDDVYQGDPTVNKLQEIVADLFGKEDALLVTSGTQGNLVSLLTFCELGNEVIVEEESHIFYDEAGSAAAFGGIQLRPLSSERGIMSAEQIEKAIRADNIHFPKTSLICIENTHNRGGGTVYPLESLKKIYNLAQSHSIPLFIDGARIFNATVAKNLSVKEYSACSDALQFCLSKGLGAPLGSVIVGQKHWIEKARKWRKSLGGGMRQSGIIAAAGIVALNSMVERLAEDHENARFLAEGLSVIPCFAVEPDLVETNIVMVKLIDFDAMVFNRALGDRGVLAEARSVDKIRFVTHKDVSRMDLEKVLMIVNEVWKSCR